MDQQSERTLAHLIRETRVAALGTLHEGEPNLAMVAYAFAQDFSAFHIHVSKLGKHTTDMENDQRVSLLITERDDGRADPQTLARVSIRGTAKVLPRSDSSYAQIKKIYLSASPKQSHYLTWEISISGKLHQRAGDSWQGLAARSIWCLKLYKKFPLYSITQPDRKHTHIEIR